jgi:uncharacterized protein (DUF2062 family)
MTEHCSACLSMLVSSALFHYPKMQPSNNNWGLSLESLQADILWGLAVFGTLASIGVYWFTYSLWKYDQKERAKEERRRSKKKHA